MTIALLTDEQSVKLNINRKLTFNQLKSVIKDLIKVYNNQTETENFFVSKETLEQFLKVKNERLNKVD